MVAVHSAAIRNTFANAVLSAIDAGSGPGKIVVKTSGGTVLGSIILNKPSGTVSGAVLTFSVSPVPSDHAADATGTAASAEIQDSNNNVVLTGTVTVTGGGGDFTLASTSITAGDPINLTSGSYTAVA